MKQKVPQTELQPGLHNALLALSFFRARHSTRRTYKNSKRNPDAQTPMYDRYCELAREYARRARGHGYRGSIRLDILGCDATGTR